jgi:hypothetical protein
LLTKNLRINITATPTSSPDIFVTDKEVIDAGLIRE